jgi:hypothetical protein
LSTVAQCRVSLTGRTMLAPADFLSVP